MLPQKNNTFSAYPKIRSCKKRPTLTCVMYLQLTLRPIIDPSFCSMRVHTKRSNVLRITMLQRQYFLRQWMYENTFYGGRDKALIPIWKVNSYHLEQSDHRGSIDRVYKNWYRVWDTQSAPKCRLPLLETVDLRQRQYASNILFLYVPTCSAWFNVSMFHLSLTGARIGPSLADPHFLIVSSVSSALAYALCYATKAMSDLTKWQ